MKLVKLSCAVDVGRAINPMAVEGQIEGGLVMGLGNAIFEDLILENGKAQSTSFLEYQVPRALDLPPPKDFSSIILEFPEPAGPFGARGVGEASISVIGAVLTNAVSHAIGKRIRSLPLTFENIWRAQMEKS